MLFYTWVDVLRQSFENLLAGAVSFIPNLVVAVVIFVIGWMVAAVLENVIAQIVKAIKVDTALKSAGVEEAVNRAGFTLDSGKFLGALVKWFIVLVFLIASFDVLGLTQVNLFLQQVVLLYLPQVIIAVLILLVAAVIAEAMKNAVTGAARASNISSAAFLGTVTRWAIWIFAALTALSQLGIGSNFFQILFTGVVVALSLAFGLAFGLGGQDAAARFVEKMREDISHRGK